MDIHTIQPTTTTTTTTVGFKRKADSIETENPSTDAVQKDEDEVKIISEKSKILLSNRVSKCLCVEWPVRIQSDENYQYSCEQDWCPECQYSFWEVYIYIYI